MRERKYDQFSDHKSDHERLLDDIRDIMDAYEAGTYAEQGETFAEPLEDWFVVQRDCIGIWGVKPAPCPAASGGRPLPPPERRFRELCAAPPGPVPVASPKARSRGRRPRSPVRRPR